MTGAPLVRNVHAELARARSLDNNIDGVGLTVIGVAAVLPLVAFGLAPAGALGYEAVGVSAAALAWLVLVRRRRIAARVARVLATLRDRPDRVAEVAYRGAIIELYVTGGEGAAFMVSADRAGAVVAALEARCPHARVHQGPPQPALRAAPVARLIDRG
jgi:hypothetical protein